VNDSPVAPTQTELRVIVAIKTGDMLNLCIAAPLNGSSVWVPVVDELFDSVFEKEIIGDLPTATQFLSPLLFLNTDTKFAAVALKCARVYIETGF
jgi:hypothetical protein